MNAGRAFVGSLLVAIGALFVAETAGLLDPGDVLARWWPSALVLLGVLIAFDRRRMGTGSAGLMVGGGVLVGSVPSIVHLLLGVLAFVFNLYAAVREVSYIERNSRLISAIEQEYLR